MLVGERMSHPIIFVPHDLSIHDALELMKRERIRRLPVIKDGTMIGIVAERDLLYASPSSATSLSIWEINYLLAKVPVRDIMTTHVLTVTDDTPIEEAARIMNDKRIGGLPVMRDDHVVGMITETDLFRIFLELMGARTTGVRVTALIADTPGHLEKLIHAIVVDGGKTLSLGTFAGEDPSNRLVTFKVSDLSLDQVKAHVEPLVERLIDIRFCC
jgi:acetoin utilization protein AcuB